MEEFKVGSKVLASSRYRPVNLNEHIKVKLTPEGEKIYKVYYHGKDYASLPTELLPGLTPDKDGYVEFQLWDFMLIFGQHFHMGVNAPCNPDCFIEVKES